MNWTIAEYFFWVFYVLSLIFASCFHDKDRVRSCSNKNKWIIDNLSNVLCEFHIEEIFQVTAEKSPNIFVDDFPLRSMCVMTTIWEIVSYLLFLSDEWRFIITQSRAERCFDERAKINLKSRNFCKMDLESRRYSVWECICCICRAEISTSTSINRILNPKSSLIEPECEKRGDCLCKQEPPRKSKSSQARERWINQLLIGQESMTICNSYETFHSLRVPRPSSLSMQFSVLMRFELAVISARVL